MNPKVSIIVPIYNAEKTLHRYRNRKLMAYYLEPVAIKHELTLEEARILLALSYIPEVKDRKELAEFLEISEKH